MKKKLSHSEFNKRCKPLPGPMLPTYGLPYLMALGEIRELDDILEMLDIVNHHPELHIASYAGALEAVNYYVEGRKCYRLCSGDSDPTLELCPEMTQLEYDQLSKSELIRRRDIMEKILREPNDLLTDAAINWAKHSMALA